MNGVRANVVPMMTMYPRTANLHAYRSMGTKIPCIKAVYHDRNERDNYQTFHSTEKKKSVLFIASDVKL